jgi:hypothetical protein
MHLVNKTGTVFFLLNDLVDVLCLSVLLSLTVLALGSPQTAHLQELWFSGCGTSFSHNECSIVAVPQLPSPPDYYVSHSALNSGTLQLTGFIKVKCTVFGFVKIDCTYHFDHLGGVNLGMAGGNPASVTANETPVPSHEEALCPEESSMDVSLQTLEATFITQ